MQQYESRASTRLARNANGELCPHEQMRSALAVWLAKKARLQQKRARLQKQRSQTASQKGRKGRKGAKTAKNSQTAAKYRARLQKIVPARLQPNTVFAEPDCRAEPDCSPRAATGLLWLSCSLARRAEQGASSIMQISSISNYSVFCLLLFQ